MNGEGQKLSKQHFAEAIEPKRARELLFKALAFLGQNPDSELAGAQVSELLAWAIDHWDIQAVPKLANIAHESI